MGLHITITTAYLNKAYTIKLHYPLHRRHRRRGPRSSKSKGSQSRVKVKADGKTIAANQQVWQQLHKAEQTALEKPQDRATISELSVVDGHDDPGICAPCPASQKPPGKRGILAFKPPRSVDEEMLHPEDCMTRARTEKKKINKSHEGDAGTVNIQKKPTLLRSLSGSSISKMIRSKSWKL